jgi:N utilization substance protein A
MLTGYTIDVYREIDEAMDDDDISLDQFNDDIDQWIIDVLKSQGLTTARQVLGTSREDLINKTDLEDETIDEIIRVLSAEFEK